MSDGTGWSGWVVLGALGFGCWLGRKTLPKAKRISETEHLLDLAKQLRKEATTDEQRLELDIFITKIHDYREDKLGVMDDDDKDEASTLGAGILKSMGESLNKLKSRIVH